VLWVDFGEYIGLLDWFLRFENIVGDESVVMKDKYRMLVKIFYLLYLGDIMTVHLEYLLRTVD